MVATQIQMTSIVPSEFQKATNKQQYLSEQLKKVPKQKLIQMIGTSHLNPVEKEKLIFTLNHLVLKKQLMESKDKEAFLKKNFYRLQKQEFQNLLKEIKNTNIVQSLKTEWDKYEKKCEFQKILDLKNRLQLQNNRRLRDMMKQTRSKNSLEPTIQGILKSKPELNLSDLLPHPKEIDQILELLIALYRMKIDNDDIKPTFDRFTKQLRTTKDIQKLMQLKTDQKLMKDEIMKYIIELAIMLIRNNQIQEQKRNKKLHDIIMSYAENRFNTSDQEANKKWKNFLKNYYKNHPDVSFLKKLWAFF